MPVSVLNLFTIGIGPSSSHTVDPLRSTQRFASQFSEIGILG